MRQHSVQDDPWRIVRQDPCGLCFFDKKGALTFSLHGIFKRDGSKLKIFKDLEKIYGVTGGSQNGVTSQTTSLIRVLRKFRPPNFSVPVSLVTFI
jgi:hypothetical protein